MTIHSRSNPSTPEARHGCCSSPAPTPANSVRDPVCGMQVDRAGAQHRAMHAGINYFFCSMRCHDRFIAEPDRYVGPAAQPPTADDQGCCSTDTTAPR